MDSYDKIHPSSASATEPLQREMQDVLIPVRDAAIEARAAVIHAEIAKVDAFKARERAEQAKNELKELIEARSRVSCCTSSNMKCLIMTFEYSVYSSKANLY